MKQALLAVILFVIVSLGTYAQPTPPSWKEVPISISGKKGDNAGKDDRDVNRDVPNHRSPVRTILPEVYCDQACHCLYVSAFSSSIAGYCIRDEKGMTVMTDVLALDDVSFAPIDLSSLPGGTYTLVIEMNGVEFEADIPIP